MKAVSFDRPGSAGVMKIINCEKPKINNNQILINVKYAGINRPDIIQREGNYPAPSNHSQILGLEVSGIVHEIGSKVKRFEKGDEVAALVIVNEVTLPAELTVATLVLSGIPPFKYNI